MAHLVTVATCQLNQWPLDLIGNRDRIVESIIIAKKAKAALRIGPELEITGYGCLDSFLDGDLYEQCWESLVDIIKRDEAQDILLDLGMPVQHKNCLYNCRVVVYNQRILLVRPKQCLANDGNFREMRYFTPWRRVRETEELRLPPVVKQLMGQQTVPIGDAVIETNDTCIGIESCEELFTPDSPHIHMGLDGVEIITNSSGSHHSLRKLNIRMELILGATNKSGGVYLYANQKGGDGERCYYDGSASIIVNGEIKALAPQFSMDDVEVKTATVNLEEVRSYRATISRRMQASDPKRQAYPRIQLAIDLGSTGETLDPNSYPSPTVPLQYLQPEDEIARGPACWLWDYLRRSRQAGFFLALSGGIDSCATAVIVFSMSRMVVHAIRANNKQVIADVRRIAGEPVDSTWLPSTPQEVTNRILHTAFMGTENSSRETRQRAKALAKAIGAYHTDVNIDSAVSAITTIIVQTFKWTLRYKVHGGSSTENLALQNLQARLRMVIGYLLAQTLCLFRGRTGAGSLLVLGSANVDECLRGYLTKYDCSAADLNPIGSISKTDLKRFIAFAKRDFELPILAEFLDAVPTAELEPITESYTQSDEADMGCTYAELSQFGILRKQMKLGPWGQFMHLVGLRPEDRPSGWGQLSPQKIYERVRFLNYYYGINRHKMTVLPPAYHAESYSPDDNRFDLRQFLYPSLDWAYEKIEREVARMEGLQTQGLQKA